MLIETQTTDNNHCLFEIFANCNKFSRLDNKGMKIFKRYV